MLKPVSVRTRSQGCPLCQYCATRLSRVQQEDQNMKGVAQIREVLQEIPSWQNLFLPMTWFYMPETQDSTCKTNGAQWIRESGSLAVILLKKCRNVRKKTLNFICFGGKNHKIGISLKDIAPTWRNYKMLKNINQTWVRFHTLCIVYCCVTEYTHI